MGATRQTRGRSRTGCNQCRRDRKKCDEVRPVCGRCMGRRTACDFDRPFGLSVGNRRRSSISSTANGPSHMSSAMSDVSYDEGSEMGHHPMSHAGPSRSGSAVGMSSAPVLWSSTPTPRLEDTRARAPPPPTQHSRGFEHSGVPSSFDRDENGFAHQGPSSVPSIPSDMQPISMPPVSPFDNVDLGLGDDFLSFSDLLTDLFGAGASMPDMTTGMAYITAHGHEHMAPERQEPSHSPNVEPHSVQQRFNAPLDRSVALRGTVPEAVLETLSDTDARLIHHFVDVQSTISIAIECDSEDNPFVKHFVPVALSSCLTGDNDNNPALHAIKAAAATHRANLMDSTRTDGSGVWRDLASSCRKRAYALISTRIDGLAKAPKEERERVLGAFTQLVGLAVVDGNTRLLPGLYRAFSVALRDLTDPTPHESFFIILASLWQTWFNFSIGVVLGRPMLKPLVDALPTRPRCPDVENVFAAPYERAQEFMKVYGLLEQVRRNDTASLLAAQLEADELITSLGHRLAHDLSRYASLPGQSRRVAIGSLLANAALRVLLLRGVFQYPIEDFRIQQCVRDAMQVFPAIKWGTESGLLISLLILATSALPAEQSQYRSFMVRLCWKGSAGPRAALATLDAVCAGDDWRQALVAVGAPILV